ncbi:MAG TPA: M28 family peptidase [Gemmatimonadaceae bacterium]|nr:M28 family peptidase [Gemmatimonadaceae bacterium]
MDAHLLQSGVFPIHRNLQPAQGTYVRASIRTALLAATLLPGSARPGLSQAESWWSHIEYLADDRMRGRETGSPQHRLAAEYVARMFRKAGLRPGGEDGFFQPVSFTGRRIVEDRSSVSLLRNGVEEKLTLGEDLTINVRVSNAPSTEARLTFAGYGLSIPSHSHDDLAGLDIAGKIVLVMPGGPRGIAGPVLSHAQAQRWATLRKRGAIGILSVSSPSGDIPWSRSSLARLNPQMTLTDTALDETAGQKLNGVINPASAEKFFAGSGHAAASLIEAALKGDSLPRFDLPVAIRATIAVDTWQVESQNVIGILPGAKRSGKADLSNQYVVLSAHLDHLGVGAPIRGDSIFNGAMDNASGVATLIELARALTRPGKRNARSIVFIAVTGEEKGLLGSRYFAHHPTVPAGSIVANVNTDMFLPIIPLRALLVNGLEESDLADDARRAGASVGVEVITDPEPERNAFIRSDQYSFIKRGIPALSLKTGFVKGSPEHETIKRWRAERYHAPSDDLGQPVNFQAAADFNRLYLRIVEEIANRPTRPRWNSDSYFAPRLSTSPASSDIRKS